MAKVDVVRVVEEYDMRFRKAMLDENSVKRLKQHQCVVFLNRALTLARIIDWERGLHEYRCMTPGVQFSLDGLRDLMKSGLGVQLAVGEHTIKSAEEFQEAA